VQVTPESVAPQVQLIATKNLFDPQRGHVDAPVTIEEGPKEVPPPSHLKLVGVVVSRDRTEAMFTDASQGGKAVRVKEGEALGAYQLTQVTPTSVKLAVGTGGGEVTLPLALLSSSQAGAAPLMVPVAPQPRAQGRPQVRMPPQPATQNPDDSAVPQEEAQELRDNIQKMQQRLRQIRRRAAVEEARARGEFTEEEEEEEED
jgi:type II secretory pathway component PulC